MNDQLTRCRVALKMLLSRGTGCLWSDIPEEDVDGCLAEADRLDSPELPDVEVFDAYCAFFREDKRFIRVGKMVWRVNSHSEIVWHPEDRFPLTNIRPLHSDADELREQLTVMEFAMKKHVGTNDELRGDPVNAAQQIRDMWMKLYENIGHTCDSPLGSVEDELSEMESVFNLQRKGYEKRLAEKPPMKTELVERLMRWLDQYINCEGHETEDPEVLYQDLAKVRDPQPMPTELVERCIKWLNECQGFTEKTELTRQKLLADLAKCSDPQPGITREQAERMDWILNRILNGETIFGEGLKLVRMLRDELRELGTARR